MARTLPWSVDRLPAANKARMTPAPRVKRERALSPARSENLADKVRATDRGRPLKTVTRTNLSRRTPSSSPVRGPPTIELMQEGYDADDNYIMVEDEFQTVAQSYTAHLHHAEYKRLVKQAREAAPKALPEPTSPMSERTKRWLKSAALQNKQNETLRRVMGDPILEEEEDEDKVTDLWSGTSLAPLMASSSQQKRSLVGLEGISSSTKAGMGLARSQSSRRSTSSNPKADDRPQHAFSRRDNIKPSSTSGAVEERETRQNDLPPMSTSRMSGHSVREHRHTPARNTSDERPAKRRFVVDLDDDSGPPPAMYDSHDGGCRSRAAPQLNGKPLSKGMANKERDKKSRLEEVPMFII
ncbi:hypothetical protein AYL99_00828 [Fonsecaea erecta]|uniref:Uncharacterized protein n=1 Tax=Fonsecaea erecta TaxID=1367422 RepID=A0A178ZZS7_9EURO|nr:hypothetical protein AYL99_00828 [Fonsecaea erecta]OAP64856.1 hypothetical protein AYL99_00828 [Fonsecaea erecta]